MTTAYKSKCCGAEVVVRGMPDFIRDRTACTMHHECKKCGKPCDVLMTPRKLWARSPAEQITPNKKKELKEKADKKDYTGEGIV